jgi:hypothetical protein
MLEMIPDLPGRIVGMRARGRVSAADFRDVFLPALAVPGPAEGKLNLLYVAGPDFEGYETGAAWDEGKRSARASLAFGKIAFVSDRALYGDAVNAFGWAIPAAAMVYRFADIDRAIAWLAK